MEHEREERIDVICSDEKDVSRSKMYDLVLNGTSIQVDACTLLFASHRVKKYLKFLLDSSKSKTQSNRAFWADIIILSIITNKILVKANPYIIEKILNPTKYKPHKYNNQNKDNITEG